MILTLEKHGLVSRVPGKPRSVSVLVPHAELPRLNMRRVTIGDQQPPNMALQRPRRPRFRSGRSLRSLGSPLSARPLGCFVTHKFLALAIDVLWNLL
jgi:hypothetical protein